MQQGMDVGRSGDEPAAVANSSAARRRTNAEKPWPVQQEHFTSHAVSKAFQRWQKHGAANCGVVFKTSMVSPSLTGAQAPSVQAGMVGEQAGRQASLTPCPCAAPAGRLPALSQQGGVHVERAGQHEPQPGVGPEEAHWDRHRCSLLMAARMPHVCAGQVAAQVEHAPQGVPQQGGRSSDPCPCL